MKSPVSFGSRIACDRARLPFLRAISGVTSDDIPRQIHSPCSDELITITRQCTIKSRQPMNIDFLNFLPVGKTISLRQNLFLFFLFTSSIPNQVLSRRECHGKSPSAITRTA